ncbi:MAG: glycosyltransferase family 2 protein [Gemmatimonadota bacterium]
MSVTLERILATTAGMSAQTEVIVIDDGSTDGTADVLSRFGSGLRMIRHRENRGYGAALKTGMAAARGGWVCLLDADGTYPVDRLPDLWARCKEDVDMVIGARTAPGARVPLIRRPAKWALRRFASTITGKPIPDLNSGFRIYRLARAASHLPLLPDGFSFTTTITIAFLSDDARVEFVPIDYHARLGKSKIRPIRNTYEFFLLILRTSVFFAPLRVFSPLGFGFMAIAALLVAYRLFIGAAFGVTATLLFVTGLQLLAVGLLADLVNRRFETNKER